MFQFLRRMIMPIMIIALVGFLATIVFQWGMDISSRRNFVSANTAAVINGEEVTWQDFNVVYDRFYEAQVAGADAELSDYEKKQLRDAVWQQILHDRLIMQQAEKYKLTVSDDELYAYLRFNPPPDIQQMSYFQTNGVFDYQKYRQAMGDPSAAPFWASVEPVVRSEILKQKLQGMVIQTAQVTEAELVDAYVAGQEKIKVGMVNVPFSRFSKVESGTEEQLRQYYQEHSEDYSVDERATLNIVRVSKDPQPYDWEIDSARAVQLYDTLKAGADFAELAQYYSEDVTAEAGGDLGWFRQGQMVEPFDQKVFSMKAGEISEPVRTRFGWHIIKVNDFRDTKEDNKTVKEANAAHILLKVIASPETLDRIHSRLEDFQASAVEYGFKESAANFELEVLTTSPFSEGAAIDQLGYDPKASEFAFSGEEGDISPVLENRSWAYVLQIAERLPAGLADFAEVENQVKLDYETEVTKGVCHDTAAAIYVDVQNGTDIERAARAHGAEYTTSDEFDRNSYIRGLGFAPEAIGAAFALKEPGQIAPPVDYARGSVILKLIERKPVDIAQFPAKRDSLYQVVLSTKQQELYGAWFDDLVDESEIINNVENAFNESGS